MIFFTEQVVVLDTLIIIAETFNIFRIVKQLFFFVTADIKKNCATEVFNCHINFII